MYKFKVGDLVLVRPGYQKDKGGFGRIVCLSFHDFGIEFDEPSDARHTLNGRCQHYRGWFVSREYLTLAEVPYDPTQVGDTDEDI